MHRFLNGTYLCLKLVNLVCRYERPSLQEALESLRLRRDRFYFRELTSWVFFLCYFGPGRGHPLSEKVSTHSTHQKSCIESSCPSSSENAPPFWPGLRRQPVNLTWVLTELEKTGTHDFLSCGLYVHFWKAKWLEQLMFLFPGGMSHRVPKSFFTHLFGATEHPPPSLYLRTGWPQPITQP